MQNMSSGPPVRRLPPASVVRSACPPPPAGPGRSVRPSAAARRPMSFGPPVRRRPPAHFVSVRPSAAARRPPARARRSCCMQHKQASNKRQSAVYSMCNTRLRQACRIPAKKRHAMQNILHHMNHMCILHRPVSSGPPVRPRHRLPWAALGCPGLPLAALGYPGRPWAPLG